MRFTKLSLVALLFAAAPAIANEHGAPPAEGGEGKSAPPREQKEFTEKTTKANALAAKLEESRKRFDELVREKEEAHGPGAKTPVLKEMVEITKQREKDQREYDKLRGELSRRYLNQGAHVNRHVEKPAAHGTEHAGEAEHANEAATHGEPAATSDHGHAETKAHAPAATQLNAGAPTLDDVLNETKALIDTKYAPFNPKKAPATSRAPASVGGEKPRAPRLRLER